MKLNLVAQVAAYIAGMQQAQTDAEKGDDA